MGGKSNGYMAVVDNDESVCQTFSHLPRPARNQPLT
jgi:hypothetical protein